VALTRGDSNGTQGSILQDPVAACECSHDERGKWSPDVRRDLRSTGTLSVGGLAYGIKARGACFNLRIFFGICAFTAVPGGGRICTGPYAEVLRLLVLVLVVGGASFSGPPDGPTYSIQ